MKKISFGSFPLNEMRAEDRKCLDRYLIKTFSDNISISDAIRNLSVTKNLMYITPDTLMKTWLGKTGDNTLESQPDRTSNDMYEKALKRAFFVLKEFYSKIKDAPFYKEFIYYPIYVEKIEKINVKSKPENRNSNTEAVETLLNYSFVILSNDLTKSLKIDEIRYDDNATLNFLFLFIEFYTSRSLNYYKPGQKPDKFNKSIHDFDQKDYEFLIRLYQFIEHSGKDPIHMTVDLYKLLGLIKEASSGTSSRSEFSLKLRGTQADFDTAALQKYKRLIKHRLFDLMKKRSNNNSDPMQYREAFSDIMSVIFKAEGLSGLYDGVDSSADMGERQRYVYNTNKYREILNLAKELVQYNKLTCKNVIQNDPMDFDFKVESGDYTIETQSHIVSQRYQEFFKAYVESIKVYLEGVIETIIKELGIEAKIKNSLVRSKNKFNKEVQSVKDEIAQLDKDISDTEVLINSLETARQQAMQIPDISAANNLLVQKNQRESALRSFQAAKVTKENELQQRRVFDDVMENNLRTLSEEISSKSSDLYKKISDSVISRLATTLTFVYDDGKRFFTNETVTKGFVDMTSSGNHNILEKTGFQQTVDHYADKSVFPEFDPKTGMINPEYLTSQIVKSLDDAFSVMADDTIEAINDNIQPQIQEMLSNTASAGNQNNPFVGAVQQQQDIVKKLLKEVFKASDTGSLFPAGFRDKLHKDIYRTRFQSNVLVNFKRMFRVREVNKKLAYDNSVSQLHPLIRKLINNGNRCQYFKSFILNYNTVEQLYNLKYLVDTQKFLYGIENQPPRKLSSTMNKIQAVLFDFLGLSDNPVWLVSESKVYLSMPDDLSLTGTSILSTIPKSDLRDVCKIKASDYWKEKSIGASTKFGNRKLKDAEKKLKQAEEARDKLLKAGGKKNQNVIDKAQAKVDRLFEELTKIKQETKDYVPNAFLFNTDENDPNKAENTSLLTDAEKSDLEKNKQELRDKLLELNPYSEEDVQKMETDMYKPQRSHPFDYTSDDDSEKSDKESQADRLFRLRAELKQAEEAEAKKRANQNQDGPSY